MASFAADLAKVTKKISVDIETVRKNTILALFRAVINATPVDEGRLKGNWQISSGSPEKGEIEITDPDGSVAIAKVESFVKSGAIKPDGAVFLANNLPYAYYIEYDSKHRFQMVRKPFITVATNLKKKYG